jgi:TolA-binding protein
MSNKDETQAAPTQKPAEPTLLEKYQALEKRLTHLEGRVEALDHYNQRLRMTPPTVKNRRGRIGV